MIRYKLERIDGTDYIFGYRGRKLVFLDIAENEDFILNLFKEEKFEKSKEDFLAIRQVKEYFQRERRVFDLDIEIKARDFQRKTWEEIYKIPFGQTKTYGQIASEIGSPRAYRAVGSATGLNPIMIVIPCHRVTRADGRVSGFRGGIGLKQKLLDFENNGK